MKPIIRVENLSKQYTIGGPAEPYSTLRESLVKTVKAPFNAFRNGRGNGNEQFWALKDINFEVMPGEVVGIIGRNGAGKSTLLKILSRITEPTTGKVDLYGRVGSLLEVGTGFHPELTGRENIYLNGAILGMKREEISKKFDEIVDFAEIEEFLDTPVKRYSSGMYMRLAFAVAANLEPEILIVDEVLAVGDAAFQKKCLGKMQDVSAQGRTVIFVSHNMAAVRTICQRGIILKSGDLTFDGDSESATDQYLRGDEDLGSYRSWSDENLPGENGVLIRFAGVRAEDREYGEPILTSENIAIDVDFFNPIDKGIVDVTWDLHNGQGVHVAHIGRVCDDNGLPEGWHRSTMILQRNMLNTDRYILDLQFGHNQRYVLYRLKDILAFELEDGIADRGVNYGKFPGVIHPVCEWKTEAVLR